MVPPASHRISRARWYSGYCRLHMNFAYETITLFGMASQPLLLSMRMRYTVHNPTGIATRGLASFHFARRYFGNRCFFLFLRLLRCFSSAGFPPHGYVFTIRYMSIAHVGCPIRKSTGRWLFAPNRSLSQLITSFIGS